jgi:hypothetical protein|tara:strand:+ start:202 stop:387 length:186 start_codon:yes stop_codon:yes gene_type:complete
MNIDELDQDTLKKIGLKRPRTKTFTAEHERRFAIKVLNVIQELSQNERARVLRRTIQMNNA